MPVPDNTWTLMLWALAGFVVVGAALGFGLLRIVNRYLRRKREGVSGRGFWDEVGRDLTSLKGGDSEHDPELAAEWIRDMLATRLRMSEAEMRSPALRARLQGYGLNEELVETVETLVSGREVDDERSEEAAYEFDRRLPRPPV